MLHGGLAAVWRNDAGLRLWVETLVIMATVAMEMDEDEEH